MPKTIKECLEELASHVEHEHAIISRIPNDLVNKMVYIKAIDDHVDTALAEIRQLLKEAKPPKGVVVEDSEIYDKYDLDRETRQYELQENNINLGKNQAIAEYTANIEKRLG